MNTSTFQMHNDANQDGTNSVRADRLRLEAPDDQRPFRFFLLVFVLSVPFWILGTQSEREFLPGLPLASLTVICPLAAAMILVYRRTGLRGVSALLKRAVDYGGIRAKRWCVLLFCLMPCAALLSYVLQRRLGAPVPLPHFGVAGLLSMALLFFVAALSEELGWTGYATEPLQHRWGALMGSILLGAIWASWHIVPLLQAHRLPAWIAWWSLYTVSARVLIVWFFNHMGKSILVAALFHTMLNLTWQLYPIHGSYWNPRFFGVITALTAGMLALIERFASRSDLLPRAVSR